MVTVSERVRVSPSRVKVISLLSKVVRSICSEKRTSILLTGSEVEVWGTLRNSRITGWVTSAKISTVPVVLFPARSSILNSTVREPAPDS